MRKYVNWLVAVCVLSPLFVSLLAGKEFWPITSFPMYSKPYRRFDWPSVMIRSGPDLEWQALIDEECYGRIGYVRFHFSALRFANEARAGVFVDALGDLTQSLAKEIPDACPHRDWHSLKVVLLRHDVRALPKPTSAFVRDLTKEVPIAR